MRTTAPMQKSPGAPGREPGRRQDPRDTFSAAQGNRNMNCEGNRAALPSRGGIPSCGAAKGCSRKEGEPACGKARESAPRRLRRAGAGRRTAGRGAVQTHRSHRR